MACPNPRTGEPDTFCPAQGRALVCHSHFSRHVSHRRMFEAQGVGQGVDSLGRKAQMPQAKTPPYPCAASLRGVPSAVFPLVGFPC